jgi:hypothetical protein
MRDLLGQAIARKSAGMQMTCIELHPRNLSYKGMSRSSLKSAEPSLINTHENFRRATSSNRDLLATSSDAGATKQALPARSLRTHCKQWMTTAKRSARAFGCPLSCSKTNDRVCTNETPPSNLASNQLLAVTMSPSPRKGEEAIQ